MTESEIYKAKGSAKKEKCTCKGCDKKPVSGLNICSNHYSEYIFKPLRK